MAFRWKDGEIEVALSLRSLAAAGTGELTDALRGNGDEGRSQGS
ncbi:MAG: hypothetical protein ABSG95_07140 [Solirubrobacteraceae bacterium]|jgi:hypothetical protein